MSPAKGLRNKRLNPRLIGVGRRDRVPLLVLPFENLTGDRAQDYFADSVTDAVTAHLAQVDGVDVISRTSDMDRGRGHAARARV